MMNYNPIYEYNRKILEIYWVYAKKTLLYLWRKNIYIRICSDVQGVQFETTKFFIVLP